jgi:hypothetical protein
MRQSLTERTGHAAHTLIRIHEHFEDSRSFCPRSYPRTNVLNIDHIGASHSAHRSRGRKSIDRALLDTTVYASSSTAMPRFARMRRGSRSDPTSSHVRRFVVTLNDGPDTMTVLRFQTTLKSGAAETHTPPRAMTIAHGNFAARSMILNQLETQ